MVQPYKVWNSWYQPHIGPELANPHTRRKRDPFCRLNPKRCCFGFVTVPNILAAELARLVRVEERHVATQTLDFLIFSGDRRL